MKQPRKRTCRRKHKNRRQKRQTRVKRQRGGVSPINAPATILTPYEQEQIFLYPLEDNMQNSGDFADSRTPFLNIANQVY